MTSQFNAALEQGVGIFGEWLIGPLQASAGDLVAPGQNLVCVNQARRNHANGAYRLVSGVTHDLQHGTSECTEIYATHDLVLSVVRLALVVVQEDDNADVKAFCDVLEGTPWHRARCCCPACSLGGPVDWPWSQ